MLISPKRLVIITLDIEKIENRKNSIYNQEGFGWIQQCLKLERCKHVSMH